MQPIKSRGWGICEQPQSGVGSHRGQDCSFGRGLWGRLGRHRHREAHGLGRGLCMDLADWNCLSGPETALL